MTKKSASRLARDKMKKDHQEHLENNTIWDDLNGTYNACAQALGQHTATALLLKRQEVFPYLKDLGATVANIQAVTRDLAQLSNELKEIYAQHQGKTGGSDDPDDVVGSIRIFEQYHLFLQRHDAVIMPAVHHILEDFGQAEEAFNRAAGLTAEPTDAERAQDPTDDTPIDVEVKNEVTH